MQTKKKGLKIGITTQSPPPLETTAEVGYFYPIHSERYYRVVACAAHLILMQGYDSVPNWPKLLVQLGLRQTRPQDIRLFWLDVVMKLFDFYKGHLVDVAIRRIKDGMTPNTPQVFPTKVEILQKTVPSQDERWRMHILLNAMLSEADTLANSRGLDRPSWFNAVHELSEAAYASCYTVKSEGDHHVNSNPD